MANEQNANLSQELKRDLERLKRRFDALEKTSGLDKKQKRFDEIDQLMQADDFWGDQKKAGVLQKERAGLERELAHFKKTSAQLSDSAELMDMAGENEGELLEVKSDVDALKHAISEMELEHMLSGPNDKNNAIMSMNVGQGGVDAQDFVEILLRMYKRYGDRRGYKIEVMELLSGEEAGLKSATILVKGPYAYGYLKAEIGVHRLVRISPYDSQGRRHTSFASVWVLPEVSDDIDIDVRTEDLRIDTYRAGGAGGQHVNKTESAIRITHLPTNTVVTCQAERSQTKNKSTAMKLLKSKLYDLEMKKRMREKDKAEAEKMEASFGSQIRNYVMAPYRLVKDLRSGHEVGNVDAVLDGDIQGFIEAFLLKKD